MSIDNLEDLKRAEAKFFDRIADIRTEKDEQIAMEADTATPCGPGTVLESPFSNGRI